MSLYFKEELPKEISAFFNDSDYQLKRDKFIERLKKNNAYEDDAILNVSFLPRVIPRNYLEKVHQITKLFFKIFTSLLYKDTSQVTNSIPPSRHNSFLLDRLNILNHLADSTGLVRFDFAVEGPPTPDNPPKLLEINVLGVGGMSYGELSTKALIETIPELSRFDPKLNPLEFLIYQLNGQGKQVVAITKEWPNFRYSPCLDIALLLKRSRKNSFNLYEVPRENLGILSFRNKKLYLNLEGELVPVDCVYLRNLDQTGDVIQHEDFIRQLLSSDVKINDSYVLQLIENKGFLATLADKSFRMQYLTREEDRIISGTILESRVVDGIFTPSPGRLYVLKDLDEDGGRGVHFPDDVLKFIKSLRHPSNLLMQEKIRLNSLNVDTMWYGRKEAIVDLGIYVAYSIIGGELIYANLAGILSRGGINNNLVNISKGGTIVPVLLS